MAEIIPFGKPPTPLQENKEKVVPSLFLKLPTQAQEKINELLKMVKNSNFSKDALALEKTEIKGWNDEQIIAFCSNSDNYPLLQQKPALVLALAGRLLGRD